MTQDGKLWWQSQHLSWAITSFGTRPQTQQWALAAQALSGQGVPEPLTRTKPEASAASCHYLTLGVTRVVIKLSFCCACAHQYQALPLFFFFSFLGEGRRVSREQNSNLGAPKFRVYQLESKWPLTLRRNSVIHQVCTEHFRGHPGSRCWEGQCPGHRAAEPCVGTCVPTCSLVGRDW